MKNTSVKKEKQNRKNHISIRLNDEELQKLKEKADEYNLSIAKFLRDRILDLPLPVKRVHDIPKINANFMKKFDGIAKNINQITYLANLENKISNRVDIQTLYLSIDRINAELEKLYEQYSVKVLEIKQDVD